MCHSSVKPTRILPCAQKAGVGRHKDTPNSLRVLGARGNNLKREEVVWPRGLEELDMTSCGQPARGADCMHYVRPIAFFTYLHCRTMPLERFAELPDLVIARVFDYTPLAVIRVITRSETREIADLALRRQWRRVGVGVNDGNSHEITNRELFAMITADVPPARPILVLRYCTPSDVEFTLPTIPGWKHYLQRHVRSVDLEIGVHQGGNWDLVSPHLRDLPLGRLLLRILDSAASSPLLAEVLPDTLTRLKLSTFDGEGPFRSLVLPGSLRHLEIEAHVHIREENLPVLPALLRTLEYNCMAGTDLSDHTDLFPSRLERLLMGSLYAFVSASALQNLPRDTCGLLVYRDGSNVEPLERAIAGGCSDLKLSLSEQCDYSAIVSLSIKRLRVSRREGRAPLLLLNHLIPLLGELCLWSLTSMDGVVVPDHISVDVRVGDVLPNEVWSIPRVTSLSLRVTNKITVLPRMAEMRFLALLSLDISATDARSVLPALASISKIQVSLRAAAYFPDILRTSAAVLQLEYKTDVFQLDARLLPPGLVQCSVRCKAGAPGCTDAPAFMLNQSLGFLEKLRSLELRVPCFDLGLVELPRGLRKLSVDTIERLGLEGAVLLPRLTELAVSVSTATRVDTSVVVYPESLYSLSVYGEQVTALARNPLPKALGTLCILQCDQKGMEGIEFPPRLLELWFDCCPNPWMAGGVPVRYPCSLRKLELRYGQWTEGPPSGFAFPELLRWLDMSGGQISDITPYVFPPSLEVLVLRGNRFAISETYAWPQVLVLDVLLDDFEENDRRTELEVLRRAIPGAVIYV